METIKPAKIHVPTVDNIEGSWFENHLVENMDIVNFAMSDNHKRGNTPSEVEESMQFHRSFVGSEFGPRE